jgi:hypothetical protein
MGSCAEHILCAAKLESCWVKSAARTEQMLRWARRITVMLSSYRERTTRRDEQPQTRSRARYLGRTPVSTDASIAAQQTKIHVPGPIVSEWNAPHLPLSCTVVRCTSIGRESSEGFQHHSMEAKEKRHSAQMGEAAVSFD